MNKLLNVSSSPHVKCSVNTQNLMLDVVIAMLPAAAFGVYNFGFHALLVLLVTSAVCVASEYVYEKLMHKPITIADGSALVTGMILALNMPPQICMGTCTGRYLCDHRCKAALRRTGTELYEPGSGCKMLPVNFLRWHDEQLLSCKPGI